MSRVEWIKFLLVGKDSSLHFVPLGMTGICIDGGEGSRGVLPQLFSLNLILFKTPRLPSPFDPLFYCHFERSEKSVANYVVFIRGSLVKYFYASH